MSRTLVLADLKGGTPCNVAMMAMGTYPQLRVVAGLNLAMQLKQPSHLWKMWMN